MKCSSLFKLWACFVLSLMILTSCASPSADPTEPVTTIPVTEPSTQASAEPPTAPPHSDLYIPGLPVEDVIVYFNEVCLDAEIVNAGDATRLQKWAEPIYFMRNGSPTDADIQTLTGFTAWLNTVEGFPGIYETQNPAEANIQFHFCSKDEMLSLMGNHFEGMDGAVTFWYEADRIYSAIICCRADLDQTLRNSVILEELYNGLGPIQDTALRSDSIIYSEYSEPQDLTEEDRLILKLLYHPRMQCGMDAAACEAVIRQLYY